MRRLRQSFGDCKLEKEEDVAMHRRQVMAAWKPCGSNSSPWVQMELPRREEGRRNSEDEHEQGRTSQQLGLPTPGGINQGALANCLELDLPRVRDVLGEGGSAGRSGAQGDRKRGPSRSPGRLSMDEDEDDEVP